MIFTTTTAHGIALSGKNAASLCVSFGLCSLPLWLPSLASVSDAARLFAPIIGALIGIATLFRVMAGDDAKKFESQKLATVQNVASAAGAAARRGGPIAGAALAVIAIGTALIWRLRPRAAAATRIPLPTPAGLPPAPKVVRPKAKDDAGEVDTLHVTPVPIKGEPAYMAFARGMLGEHEGTTKKPNPKVQALYAACGFPAIKDTVGVAWCAAFLGGSLKAGGFEPMRSLMAASYDHYGDGVALDDAKPGDIVRLWRDSPKSGLGHVGFFVKREGSKVYLLGGNQSDSVSIAAFPASRVIAVRRPRSLMKSATIQGAALSLFGTVSTGVLVAQSLEAAKPLHGPLKALGYSWADSAAAWLMVASVAASVVGSLVSIWGRQRVRRKSGG